MSITLYCFPLSPPSRGIEMALDFKGLDYERREIPAGVHAAALRVLGFSGITVPAIRANGERVQGSLRIVRWLEDHHPDPSLYPEDAEARAAVEQAERWGESELQPVPKLVFRHAMITDPDLRTWMAGHAGLPLPKLSGFASWPVAKAMALHVGADEDGARRAYEKLPALLDHADELVAAGTIGTDQLNAADLQILPVVRSMLELHALQPLLEDRPVADLARERIEPLPGPVPLQISTEWTAPAHG